MLPFFDPQFSFYSTAVSNWDRCFPPYSNVSYSLINFISNIDAQFLFTGSKNESWFYAVHWQFEMHAVPGIKVS